MRISYWSSDVCSSDLTPDRSLLWRRFKSFGALAILTLATGIPAHTERELDYASARARLVDSIRGYARSMGARADPRVLAAMRTVPRPQFVPAGQRDEAFRDYPLPIGEGDRKSGVEEKRVDVRVDFGGGRN